MDEPKYTGEDILVYKSAAVACRRRPQMYVCDTEGPVAIAQLLRESLCLALESGFTGDSTKIRIERREDHSLLVWDNGQGFDPTKMHGKKPLYESIFTNIYGCRELKEHNRELCTGGIVITNGLSSWFHIDLTWNGEHWHQPYAAGEPVSAIAPVGTDKSTWRQISFLPDSTIFPSIELHKAKFTDWLADTCREMEGCSITFIDHIAGTSEILHPAR